MSDADRYVAAFQGLLDQLERGLKEAQDEVADFQRCIEHHGGLPNDQRRRLYRRLRSQESDRRLIGRKDQRRDLTALLADPTSSSKLIIPELTDRILKEIGTRAGRLLWEAHKDGLVTEPVRLWEFLKCRPAHAEPDESWAFAVDCLRKSHPSAFKSTAGEWSRISTCSIALSLTIRVLDEGKVDSSAVILMRGEISRHQLKENAPRTELARSGGSYQKNLKALDHLYTKGEYSRPPKKQIRRK